jgi:hypothetical protein
LKDAESVSEELQDSKPESSPERREPKIQATQEFVQDSDRIELGLRFLVGLLAVGGEEAVRRLRETQRQLNDDPSLWNTEASVRNKSIHRQVWHLGIGLIWRGQRRLRKELRRGFELTLGTVDRAASTSTQRAGSLLPNPIRGVLEERLVHWRNQALEIVKEGESQEQKGRALAKGALAELISEIMDEVAKNPEIQEFVQDMVGQQGAGLATSVVDNARSAALTADDAAEGLLRWLLKRTPRQELPSSPVEGQTQTMYAPKVKVEGNASDDFRED